MKQGYTRVSKANHTSAAGKIRKMRCDCTDKVSFTMFDGDGNQIRGFFNSGETGFPEDKCPTCRNYLWYNV